MPNTATKLVSLDNLATYNTHVEPKITEITYEDYLKIPAATRASDNKTYCVTDLNALPTNFNDLIFTKKLTLTAGSTSLTFTDSRITANSLIQIFYPNTNSDVAYTEFTQNSATSFTLTFDAQSADVQVVALIMNV